MRQLHQLRRSSWAAKPVRTFAKEATAGKPERRQRRFLFGTLRASARFLLAGSSLPSQVLERAALPIPGVRLASRWMARATSTLQATTSSSFCGRSNDRCAQRRPHAGRHAQSRPLFRRSSRLSAITPVRFSSSSKAPGAGAHRRSSGGISRGRESPRAYRLA